MWDPEVYLRFGAMRTRPCLELAMRVPLSDPQKILDLGCGPGNSTSVLATRWPEADITGVDSSQEMLERAALEGPPDASWQKADLASWEIDASVDLIFSNATYQWLDGHEVLFPKLMGNLNPGGALAIQMPRNFDAPSHVAIRHVAGNGPWTSKIKNDIRAGPVADTAAYHRLLVPYAESLDIWETEYLQVLEGEDAVYNWVKGTALRPFLSALEGSQHNEFVAAVKARLNEEYPPEPDGTTFFPFKRIFIIATRSAA